MFWEMLFSFSFLSSIIRPFTMLIALLSSTRDTCSFVFGRSARHEMIPLGLLVDHHFLSFPIPATAILFHLACATSRFYIPIYVVGIHFFDILFLFDIWSIPLTYHFLFFLL